MSEAGETLGIAQSSAHRLIHTLLAHGYLLRTHDGRHYILGTRAQDLAIITNADLQLGAFGSRYAEDLSKRVELTVLIGGSQGCRRRCHL